MSVSVAVLVVSYNTAETTLECLAAVSRSRGVAAASFVYDNASADGSADLVGAASPNVTLVRGRDNIGFGRANNVLCEMSQSPYVLLLNSDCIVEETTLADCVGFLHGRPDAAAVACQLRNPDGSIQASCRAFPSLGGELARILLPYQMLRHLPHLGAYYMGGWSHDEIRPVEQPSGAFILIRRGSWGPGKLFDERFFMYYEDVDLCRRLWRHGPVWFYPGAKAMHLGEQSSSRARAAMASALAVSRHRYFQKWHSARTARAVDVLGGAASAARWIGWSAARALPQVACGEERANAHWAATRSAFSQLKASGYE